MTFWRGLRRFLSRISNRLLAFNVLLLALPLAGLYYFDVYEERLREAQERSMVQQGRILAAALGGVAELDPALAQATLQRLEQRTTARLRVLDAEGSPMADSSALGPRLDELPEGDETTGSEVRQVQENWLYRLGALPFRLYRKILEPPRQPSAPVDFYRPDRPYRGREVLEALSGSYGSMTRVGPASVTFYSAIPIRTGGRVIGAVLVSQSTFQIQQDLYRVRLVIFQVFLVSVLLAIVLSLLVSTTISQPIRRLRREAAQLLDARGRLTGRFGATTRQDEIGDLTRDLRELARRLSRQQESSETFTADVSHEFKNPLASIRSATEVLVEIDDLDERRRFAAMVEGNVSRMERMLTTLREVSLIDAGAEDDAEVVALGDLLQRVVDGWQLAKTGDNRTIEVQRPSQPILVKVAPDRLAQVFENLLDNADSFSPEDETIHVQLTRDDGVAVASVTDLGPGIPKEHRERVFDRFFSFRPSDNGGANGRHTGLGLSIVRAIVEGYGGSVRALDAQEGGAVLELRLPIAQMPDAGDGT